MAGSKGKISIDLSKDIVKLAADGKTFLVEPEAEKSILAIMRLKARCEAALESIGHSIGQQGEKLSSGFSGVQGDALRVGYRTYGAKYGFDGSVAPEQIFDEFPMWVNKKVTYSIAEAGSALKPIPKGIQLNVRKKKASFQELKAKDES